MPQQTPRGIFEAGFEEAEQELRALKDPRQHTRWFREAIAQAQGVGAQAREAVETARVEVEAGRLTREGYTKLVRGLAHSAEKEVEKLTAQARREAGAMRSRLIEQHVPLSPKRTAQTANVREEVRLALDAQPDKERVPLVQQMYRQALAEGDSELQAVLSSSWTRDLLQSEGALPEQTDGLRQAMIEDRAEHSSSSEEREDLRLALANEVEGYIATGRSIADDDVSVLRDEFEQMDRWVTLKDERDKVEYRFDQAQAEGGAE